MAGFFRRAETLDNSANQKLVLPSIDKGVTWNQNGSGDWVKNISQASVELGSILTATPPKSPRPPERPKGIAVDLTAELRASLPTTPRSGNGGHCLDYGAGKMSLETYKRNRRRSVTLPSDLAEPQDLRYGSKDKAGQRNDSKASSSKAVPPPSPRNETMSSDGSSVPQTPARRGRKLSPLRNVTSETSGTPAQSSSASPSSQGRKPSKSPGRRSSVPDDMEEAAQEARYDAKTTGNRGSLLVPPPADDRARRRKSLSMPPDIMATVSSQEDSPVASAADKSESRQNSKGSAEESRRQSSKGSIAAPSFENRRQSSKGSSAAKPKSEEASVPIQREPRRRSSLLEVPPPAAPRRRAKKNTGRPGGLSDSSPALAGSSDENSMGKSAGSPARSYRRSQTLPSEIDDFGDDEGTSTAASSNEDRRESYRRRRSQTLSEGFLPAETEETDGDSKSSDTTPPESDEHVPCVVLQMPSTNNEGFGDSDSDSDSDSDESSSETEAESGKKAYTVKVSSADALSTQVPGPSPVRVRRTSEERRKATEENQQRRRKSTEMLLNGPSANGIGVVLSPKQKRVHELRQLLGKTEDEELVDKPDPIRSTDDLLSSEERYWKELWQIEKAIRDEDPHGAQAELDSFENVDLDLPPPL